MKRSLTILLALITLACVDNSVNTPVTPSPQRYSSEVFTNVTVSNNIVYGNNTTQGGVNTDLAMDVYQPTGDTLAARPLVILAHGGSFIGGSRTSMATLADLLAKSGFVVASISYRLIDVPINATSYPIGLVQAIGDLKAATRFFRADAATNNTYKIDTSNIMIGGYSAGALMALHHAYLSSEAEIPALFLPAFQSNGGLEGNSGHAGFSSSIKAAFSIAGAIIDTSVISAGEAPLFSIHGTSDPVVPYTSGNTGGSGITMFGSSPIHTRLQTLGITEELFSIANGDHAAYQSCGDCNTRIRAFLAARL